MDFKFTSFVKAMRAFFDIPADKAVMEYKALNEQDKIELSTMLNALPDGAYSHPQYPTAKS